MCIGKNESGDNNQTDSQAFHNLTLDGDCNRCEVARNPLDVKQGRGISNNGISITVQAR